MFNIPEYSYFLWLKESGNLSVLMNLSGCTTPFTRLQCGQQSSVKMVRYPLLYVIVQAYIYSTYAHTLCLLSFSVCIYIICGNVCTFWCFHTTGNLAASASVDTTIKVRLLVIS